MTTEEVVSKFTEDNVKGVILLQRILEDFVLFIQAKITSGQITGGISA